MFLKNKFLLVILSLILLGMFSITSFANSSNPDKLLKTKLIAKVDRAQVKAGDEITFTVELKYPKEVSSPLNVPELGDKIVSFRIVDTGIIETKKDEVDDNWLRTGRWYKLATDLGGSYVLPAIEFKIGSETYKTSEIFIEVMGATGQNKANEQEQAQLRDIKPLLNADTPFPWLIFSLLCLLAIALSIAAYYLYRRYHRQQVAAIGATSIPADEEALLALQALANENLLDGGDNNKQKKYHFRLSEITRIYVERMLHIPATERTTQEIKSLIAHWSEEPVKKEFLAILEKTDFVKFTDFHLSRETSEELMNKAKIIIEKTRPKIEVTSAKVNDMNNREEDVV